MVVEDGQIVERGTHDELLAKGGAYARYDSLQLDGAGAPRSQGFEADTPNYEC